MELPYVGQHNWVCIGWWLCCSLNAVCDGWQDRQTIQNLAACKKSLGRLELLSSLFLTLSKNISSACLLITVQRSFTTSFIFILQDALKLADVVTLSYSFSRQRPQYVHWPTDLTTRQLLIYNLISKSHGSNSNVTDVGTKTSICLIYFRDRFFTFDFSLIPKQ